MKEEFSCFAREIANFPKNRKIAENLSWKFIRMKYFKPLSRARIRGNLEKCEFIGSIWFSQQISELRDWKTQKKNFVISLRRLDPSGRRLGQDLLNLQDTESIFCVCLCFCFGLVCLNFSSGKRKVPYSKQKLVKLVQNYIPISLLANEGLRESWRKKKIGKRMTRKENFR